MLFDDENKKNYDCDRVANKMFKGAYRFIISNPCGARARSVH